MFIKVLNFCRVKEWYHQLGFILLGMVYVSGNVIPDVRKLFFGFCLGALYLAGGHVYNTSCDSKKIDTRSLWASFALLLIFLASSFCFIREYTFFFVVGLIFNSIYSAPRLLWKRFHLFSVFLNGYLFGMLFLFGSRISSITVSLDVFLLTLFFILTMAPFQIIHELSHLEEDGIAYNEHTVKRYVREIYVFLLSVGIGAVLLEHFFMVHQLFVITTLLFLVVFFTIAWTIARQTTYNAGYIKHMRAVLKYVGMIYGGLLWLFFSR